jgi:hypothetical protein
MRFDSPVFVYKRFTSHPLLESRTIPTRKHKLNAYAVGGGLRYWQRPVLATE